MSTIQRPKKPNQNGLAAILFGGRYNTKAQPQDVLVDLLKFSRKSSDASASKAVGQENRKTLIISEDLFNVSRDGLLSRIVELFYSTLTADYAEFLDFDQSMEKDRIETEEKMGFIPRIEKGWSYSYI